MKIINFGSLNIDHVYGMKSFVMPGETKAAEKYEIFCGGKGLNQSVAAAKAGGEILHAGALGKGGDMLLDMLVVSNVDTSLLMHSDIPQGHAIIQVADSGENCIILYRGSNFAVTEEYVDIVLDKISAPAYIMLQNETSCIEYIIEKAHEKGLEVVLNASPIDESLLKVDFNKLSWIMINEIEGAQISGKTAPEEILNELSRRYPDLRVLLTLGRNGSVCSVGGQRYYQAAYPVTAVDTTAAGDTYSGYFVASLAAGLEIKTAMERASMASAISVMRKGAAPSIPELSEVLKALKI